MFERVLMSIPREELVLKIKCAADGSLDALYELCDIYKPLIEAEVRRHTVEGMTSQDIADMREEAIVCFSNAVCNYNYGEENVEFGLYAKICIGNALVSFIRQYKKHLKNRALPINEAVAMHADGHYDPLEKLIEEERFLSLKREIQNNLSPYESKVWWMYVSGMSAQKIAEKLECDNVKSVTNAIYRIRKKLRQVIKQD